METEKQTTQQQPNIFQAIADRIIQKGELPGISVGLSTTSLIHLGTTLVITAFMIILLAKLVKEL
jgi:hypothetical protein